MSDPSKTSKPSPFSNEAQHEQVDWNLTNHSPDPEQVGRIEGLREYAKSLSHAIIDLCPSGPDRTLALRNIEQGTMMAVAAIAREPRVSG